MSPLWVLVFLLLGAKVNIGGAELGLDISSGESKPRQLDSTAKDATRLNYPSEAKIATSDTIQYALKNPQVMKQLYPKKEDFTKAMAGMYGVPEDYLLGFDWFVKFINKTWT